MAKLGINTGSSADAGDGSTLRAGGNIVNSNFDEVYSYFGDGTNLTFTGGDWGVNATGITTTSNVGIGTTTATAALTVSGDVSVSGTSTAAAYVKSGGTASQFLKGDGTVDSSTYLTTTGNGIGLSGIVTSLVAGTNVTISSATGNVQINASTGGGASGYFVQNATGIHTLSNTGIGTTTASHSLTVNGNSRLVGVTSICNPNNPDSDQLIFSHDQPKIEFMHGGATKAFIQGSNGNLELRSVGTKQVKINDQGIRIGDANNWYDVYLQSGNNGETYVGTGITFRSASSSAHLSGDLHIVGVSTFQGKVDIWEDFTVGSNSKFIVDGSTGITTCKAIGIFGGASNEFLKADGTTDSTTYLSSYTETDTLQNVCSRGTTTTTNITANSLIKSGGTSTQYLMADGSTSTSSVSNVRTDKSATTSSTAAGASVDLSITAFKSYNLLKIAIDHPAWVVLYVDAASRTADSSRAEGTDPTPGSGVIAEVITSQAGASTFLFSPGIFGWNNDSTPATTVYAKVKNKDSVSRDITVTLTVIQAEG